MELSTDQQYAINSLMDWWGSSKKNQYITLGGYAGTGKSTLIAQLRQQLQKKNTDLKVAFCSFTGKAARVLETKLREQKVVLDDDSVSTIHSLIYSPIVDKKENIIGWKKKESDELEADLLIVDEASMIDSSIWNDLLTYGKPIIAVGDHGQLPPINGNFNLMAKPELLLTQIHRQGKDNPIIELSIQARENGQIKHGKYGLGVKKINRQDSWAQEEMEELLREYNQDTLVLCGYNSTRIKLNAFIRNALEFEQPAPQPNDRVICLRNNHAMGIYNGMLGNIFQIKKKDSEWYEASILMDGEEAPYEGLIMQSQFNQTEPMNFGQKRSWTLKGDLFDFGYALTVHKAQGSQAKRVILFEERFSKMDDDMWRRWLYTAVTRAEKELYIIG